MQLVVRRMRGGRHRPSEGIAPCDCAHAASCATLPSSAPKWRNGRRGGFKIRSPFAGACGFDSHLRHAFLAYAADVRATDGALACGVSSGVGRRSRQHAQRGRVSRCVEGQHALHRDRRVPLRVPVPPGEQRAAGCAGARVPQVQEGRRLDLRAFGVSRSSAASGRESIAAGSELSHPPRRGQAGLRSVLGGVTRASHAAYESDVTCCGSTSRDSVGGRPGRPGSHGRVPSRSRAFARRSTRHGVQIVVPPESRSPPQTRQRPSATWRRCHAS